MHPGKPGEKDSRRVLHEQEDGGTCHHDAQRLPAGREPGTGVERWLGWFGLPGWVPAAGLTVAVLAAAVLVWVAFRSGPSNETPLVADDAQAPVGTPATPVSWLSP